MGPRPRPLVHCPLSPLPPPQARFLTPSTRPFPFVPVSSPPAPLPCPCPIAPVPCHCPLAPFPPVCPLQGKNRQLSADGYQSQLANDTDSYNRCSKLEEPVKDACMMITVGKWFLLHRTETLTFE